MLWAFTKQLIYKKVIKNIDFYLIIEIDVGTAKLRYSVNINVISAKGLQEIKEIWLKNFFTITKRYTIYAYYVDNLFQFLFL